MSQICHETEEYVTTPYHNVMLMVVHPDDGRVAYSELEVSICDAVYARIADALHQEPQQLSTYVGYAVETHDGTVGGSHGTVQMQQVSQGRGDYRYLDAIVAQGRLPKCVETLTRDPIWVENIGGTWCEVAWPYDVHERAQEH